MRMAAPQYYSADMVRALPDDGNRYETVYGELLVTPAPRALHQLVLRRLLVALDGYLRDNHVGELLSSPADISWGPDILVQPDLFVVDLDQARTLDWAAMKNLLLAVEILSPSTQRYDRFTKRRLYQQVGIPLYWIVDPESATVEVWHPDMTFPTTERGTITWQPDGAGEAFSLDLTELFRPI
ncbi:MAG: Uma2 family endonuclease [Gemmatimonadales bacterium]